MERNQDDTEEQDESDEEFSKIAIENSKEALDFACRFAVRPDERKKSQLQILKTSYETHNSFPKKPLMNDVEQYKKLDLDALFFIFYHQQGSYQQFVASKLLKSKDWIYHKQYQTWFQRQGNPKATSPEKELGTYLYFDYEVKWTQQKKANFELEYAKIENDVKFK
ncbi:NOT5_2 [Blepharisma stoltei]|uniref:NOT2/NOT3/NOT5 C-terminal domain-containing protein n=1 Tax=Blepharisma stoltei TaxID=1481888 RepID=A0AAU9J3E2_9CILI|nr:unnamed protein product [Blepharisma stoltei]